MSWSGPNLSYIVSGGTVGLRCLNTNLRLEGGLERRNVLRKVRCRIPSVPLCVKGFKFVDRLQHGSHTTDRYIERKHIFIILTLKFPALKTSSSKDIRRTRV